MKYTMEEIENAYESKKLFVKALTDIEDDLGTYCYKDKLYEVIDLHDDKIIIECEEIDGSQLQTNIDDEDFEFIIK